MVYVGLEVGNERGQSKDFALIVAVRGRVRTREEAGG